MGKTYKDKKMPKPRIPIPPPEQPHSSKKDYKREKHVDLTEAEEDLSRCELGNLCDQCKASLAQGLEELESGQLVEFDPLIEDLD